jgi:hypothetical protein
MPDPVIPTGVGSISADGSQRITSDHVSGKRTFCENVNIRSNPIGLLTPRSER